ncbi:MAG: YlxM family DNA-binding protein [Clostridia bacterium]|jgi:predicted DNA-binding protein YlxM (UPF0122 family)|nr:YlxM family DNA-binding protein [Clostridia bacterium]
MKNVLEKALMFDFYGELLTEKQKEIYELYYLNDYSLTEIADDYGTTRQAVSDLLKRTENKLQNFEGKLGLIEKFSEQKRQIKEILNITKEIDNTNTKDVHSKINDIEKIINSII